MKVTIAFRDDGLYRAVRVRAAQAGRPVRDLVEEALTEWLERQEDREDIAASSGALREYEERGGEHADRYFQRLVAEGRVQYDTD